MTISLILTILNEESTITDFLESVLQQTLFPDEIVIVDGASTDNTVRNILPFIPKFDKHHINLRLLSKRGNRSIGRNEAIRHATGNIIASTDAGCLLDKNWLKNITKQFDDIHTDVVAGYYKGQSKTIFQKCLIPYALVMEDKLDPKSFLPATRSMAFKKSIWAQVNGFPEQYSHNEDYVFANNLKSINANILFAKNALVYWQPRENIKQAYTMFYRFAYGDAEAHIFRPKVIFIFLRYMVGIILLLLYSLFHKQLFGIATIALFISYLVWAVVKNYRYVKKWKACIYLPSLQIASDAAVIFGTTQAVVKDIYSRLVVYVKTHKIVSLIIFCYILVSLSQLNWGLPSNSHPFSYNMDEWAQAFSLRTTFKYGTPHINGGDEGTVFFYLVSGLLLAPFILLHITNPFLIKSPLMNFDLQHILFIILRLQSMLYSILSIIVIGYVARKYLHTNAIVTTILFVCSPIFFMLSIFYRHDIAVVFWILLSFLFSFRYENKPTTKNFLLLGLVSGLSVAIKISASPLIPIYILSFFLFTPDFKRKYKTLVVGTCVSVFAFIVTGIPDALISFQKFTDWILLVAFQNHQPQITTFHSMPYRFYYLFILYSSLFGPPFYAYFIFSTIILAFILWINFTKKTFGPQQKRELFLILSFVLFALSIYALKVQGFGGRLLVITPLSALISALIFQKLLRRIHNKYANLLWFLFVIFTTLQIMIVGSWLTLRFFPNPRSVASDWIVQHIAPGTTIDIENIPIFQDVPDILLKDYYTKVYFPHYVSRYSYTVIGSDTKEFASIVIISNTEAQQEAIVEQSRKQAKIIIIRRLESLGYKKIKSFTANLTYFSMINPNTSYFNGLMSTAETITIFKKPM